MGMYDDSNEKASRHNESRDGPPREDEHYGDDRSNEKSRVHCTYLIGIDRANISKNRQFTPVRWQHLPGVVFLAVC